MNRLFQVVLSLIATALVALSAVAQTPATAPAAPGAPASQPAAQPPPASPATSAGAPVARPDVGLRREGSTFAASVDSLFWFIVWLCTFFFVLLMVLAAYFSLKYRRRPGVPQERSPSHNTPLELTWSVGPLLILLVVFWWGFDIYMNMRMAPANAEIINVKAMKWDWSFSYDNGATGGTSTKGDATVRIADKEVKIFAVPVGRPVRLVMISDDVIHSLYVPDFRKKTDVFPMRYTTLWFEATEPGDHYLFCAEYCGDGHSQMAALIRAMPEAEYQQYKRDNTLDIRTLPPEKGGELLRLIHGCNACHSVDGSKGTGPSWKGIYGSKHSVILSSGEKKTVTVDDTYIRQSILEPAAMIVEGYPNQMITYQGKLSEDDIARIIAYIRSLNPGG
jgi:cytochrome c oxidase subunit 2